MVSDIRPLNSDIPDSGIRAKLGQIRKLADGVNKLIQPDIPIIDTYRPRPIVPTQPPLQPKQLPPRDDDLTFFICSVVSELHNRIVVLLNQNIKEWLPGVPAEALVKKFKDANVKFDDIAANKTSYRPQWGSS